jgi:hypothetical protein
MNTSDVMAPNAPESHSHSAARIPAGRLVYWSIMREFWESPSIYMAPLAVAAVALSVTCSERYFCRDISRPAQ